MAKAAKTPYDRLTKAERSRVDLAAGFWVRAISDHPTPQGVVRYVAQNDVVVDGCRVLLRLTLQAVTAPRVDSTGRVGAFVIYFSGVIDVDALMEVETDAMEQACKGLAATSWRGAQEHLTDIAPDAGRDDDL